MKKKKQTAKKDDVDMLLSDIQSGLTIKTVSSYLKNSTVNGKELNADTFIDPNLFVEVTDLAELISRKTYLMYKIVYPDKTIYKIGGWFILRKLESKSILVGNTPYSDIIDKTKAKKIKPIVYCIKTEYHDHITGHNGFVKLYRKLTDKELSNKIKCLQIALDSRNQMLVSQAL
jgi:hypothetical protein